MSLFKTAYDTTVGTGLHVKDVALQLRHVQASGGLPIMADHDVEPILAEITGQSSTHVTVPVFSHPFEVLGVDKKRYLFMDYRPFVSLDSSDQWDIKVNIRNSVEYNFAKARLLMSKVWLTQPTNSISGLSSMPMGVYSSWISESITHRFALDMGDQSKLAILAALFYQSLFYEEGEITETVKTMFASNIVRTLRMPADLVFKTIENVPELTNVKSFCTAVKTVLENSRLEDFNEGILVLLLRNTWFGANSGEILAVALEHPPTWVSLVYISLSERTFKNSSIAKVSERYAKGGAGDTFSRSFIALAKSVEPQKL